MALAFGRSPQLIITYWQRLEECFVRSIFCLLSPILLLSEIYWTQADKKVRWNFRYCLGKKRVNQRVTLWGCIHSGCPYCAIYSSIHHISEAQSRNRKSSKRGRKSHHKQGKKICTEAEQTKSFAIGEKHPSTNRMEIYIKLEENLFSNYLTSLIFINSAWIS